MKKDNFFKKIKNSSSEDLKKLREDLRNIKSKSDKDSLFEDLFLGLDSYFSLSKDAQLIFLKGLKVSVKSGSKKDLPDLFDFVLGSIKEGSGNVRLETVRLTKIILNHYFSEKEIPEDKMDIFKRFVDDTLLFLEIHYEPGYEDVDTSEMPASRYKSFMMVLDLLAGLNLEDFLVFRNSDTGYLDYHIFDFERDYQEGKRKATSRKKKDRKTGNPNFNKKEISDFKDLPRPEEFPFYKKIASWSSEVLGVAEESGETGDFWIFTEEAADLFRNIDVLNTETYHQLCNRYLIDKLNINETDYGRTNLILKGSIKEIKTSLKKLSDSNFSQKEALKSSLNKLSKIEELILNI